MLGMNGELKLLDSKLPVPFTDESNQALVNGYYINNNDGWTRHTLDWVENKSLSVDLAAAVTLDDQRIILIGGLNGNGTRECGVVYDSNTRGIVRTLPSLNCARYGHAAVTCGGKIFVIGGFDGEKFLDSIEYLDLTHSNSNWVTLKSTLPGCVTGCAAVSVRDRIYVMGGWNGDARLATTSIVYTETEEILEGPCLETTRSACAATVIGDTIWLVGGYSNDGKEMTKAETLDTESPDLTWRVKDYVFKHNAFISALVVDEEFLVLLGNNLQEVVNVKKWYSWTLPKLKVVRYPTVAVKVGTSEILFFEKDCVYSYHLQPVRATNEHWEERFEALAKHRNHLSSLLQQIPKELDETVVTNFIFDIKFQRSVLSNELEETKLWEKKLKEAYTRENSAMQSPASRLDKI